MSVLDRMEAHHLRYLRAIVGFAGGFATGVLIATERYVPAAGIGAATILATLALPKLYASPVTDERTEAISRWASRTALRFVSWVATAGLILGPLAIEFGYLDLAPELVGGFFGVAAVVIVYLTLAAAASLLGWNP